jgi:hypothetical protein
MRWLVVLALVGCGSGSPPADSGAGGAGGAGTGGAVGTGGADGSLPRDSGTAVDAASSPDQGSMMTTGKSVDECFAGLRKLQGGFQDATSASSDGKYKMRLALETGDRGGTSGSYAWAAVRFALETPDGNVCVTDEAALSKAYAATHHNCMDVLTVTSGSRTYRIDNPDAAADYANPMAWRRSGTLRITTGAQPVGPIMLQTQKCNAAQAAGPACMSGGPCQ